MLDAIGHLDSLGTKNVVIILLSSVSFLNPES